MVCQQAIPIIDLPRMRNYIDVIHHPGNSASLLPAPFVSAPVVVTIHDLMAFKTSSKRNLYYRAGLRATARRADGIIFVSNQTMSDFFSVGLRTKATAVEKVIPNPVNNVFYSGAPFQERACNKRTIVSPGLSHPRKNIRGVLESFRALRTRDVRNEYELALYGDDVKIRDMVREEPCVRYVFRPTDAELSRLYSTAACAWLLSLDEGFGYPVIEALASGTPVVASYVGGIPFASGGYASLVRPGDARMAAQATVEEIETDNGAKRRARREYAMRFHPKEFGKHVVAFYDEVARASRR